MRRTHRNFMAPEDIKRLLSNKILCFTVRSLGQASTYFSICIYFFILKINKEISNAYENEYKRKKYAFILSEFIFTIFTLRIEI